jgi:hypothetical protein
MDEAIAGTYWVAQQNGVTYSEEQIQEKFLEQLDEQLDNIVENYHEYWQNQGLPGLNTKTTEYVNAIRDYYVDPCLETFDNVVSIAFQIEDEVGKDYFEWSSLIDIVSRISSGLGLSMLSYGYDNKNKFAMAPRAVSPVEVSTKERELVFDGNE